MANADRQIWARRSALIQTPVGLADTATMPTGDRHPADRFADAVMHSGERAIASNPTYAAVAARTGRTDTAFARFGRSHPIIGGVAAALYFGTAMFLIFSIPAVVLALIGFFSPTVFVAMEVFLALVSGVGGAVFGFTVGRLWFRERAN